MIRHGFALQYGDKIGVGCVTYENLEDIPNFDPRYLPVVPVVQMTLDEYERLVLPAAERAEERIQDRDDPLAIGWRSESQHEELAYVFHFDPDAPEEETDNAA